MRVVVTSGGTREPLDRVRYLTNLSTGRTGAAISGKLAQAGLEVLYLHAEGAAMPAFSRSLEARVFRTYEDLEGLTRAALQDYRPGLFIQAAAISDFQVEKPLLEGKLPSGEALTLKLLPRKKIVGHLKAWSPTPLSVVAFKLTDSRDPAAVTERLRALAHEGVDWIVHNDLSAREGDHARGFTIYRAQPQLKPVGQAADAAGLAQWVGLHWKLISERSDAV